MISLLQKARQPFNANSVAQAAAIAALEDEDWVLQCRRRNENGLKQLEQGLERTKLRICAELCKLHTGQCRKWQKYF